MKQPNATPAPPRKPRQRPSYQRLHEFVEWIAQKPYNDPDDPDVASEDADAERNEMIEEAMRLLGKLRRCSSCRQKVPYTIRNTEGREVCPDCQEAADEPAH